ncbi:hypothetical protein [Tomitella gaofuii]|uniref:hypothetical protein n=1 Tax=Tomitella gaofuii TaxID=2760083 RepID=UPI0015FA1C96|nr:hypothetical protein [Tomitella gaofuii]
MSLTTDEATGLRESLARERDRKVNKVDLDFRAALYRQERGRLLQPEHLVNDVVEVVTRLRAAAVDGIAAERVWDADVGEFVAPEAVSESRGGPKAPCNVGLIDQADAEVVRLASVAMWRCGGPDRLPRGLWRDPDGRVRGVKGGNLIPVHMMVGSLKDRAGVLDWPSWCEPEEWAAVRERSFKMLTGLRESLADAAVASGASTAGAAAAESRGEYGLFG